MGKNKLNAKTTRDDLLRTISNQHTQLQEQSDELKGLLDFYMEDEESLDIDIFINYKDILKLEESIEKIEKFINKLGNH